MMTSMEAHLLGRTLIILRSIVHATPTRYETSYQTVEVTAVSDDLLRDARDLLDKIEEFEPELRKMK